MANSLNKDGTAHYKQYHQDLHYSQKKKKKKMVWSAGLKGYIAVLAQSLKPEVNP